jgi:hypothetical protein
MKDYLDIEVRILPETTTDDRAIEEDTTSRAAYDVEVRVKNELYRSRLEIPFLLQDLAGHLYGSAGQARVIVQEEEATSQDGQSQTLKELGEQLYEALFCDDAKTALTTTMAIARDRGNTGTRIRLLIDLARKGMTEVASLPWELMRPKGRPPLVMSTGTPLVRSMDNPVSTEPQPLESLLRILVVASNPRGTGQLNLDKELSRIKETWGSRIGVEVDYVKPQREHILDQLARKDYHVIHYMGHGDFSNEKGGMLLLEKDDGNREVDAITGEELGVLIQDEQSSLQLVFLNACKSATSDARQGVDPFSGVATALINQGVTAVLAMQFPISDEAAIRFADTFYKRVSSGYPLEAAVSEARKLLYKREQPEWATPVLFLRSKEGMLFAPAKKDMAPQNAVSGSEGGAVVVETTDPWGAESTDAVRVFLAASNDTLRPTHRKLSKELKAAGIYVIDSIPPPYEAEEHEKEVRKLVRSADLCIHLLGESPGEAYDENDELNTYPVEQLRLGLESAHSQLVLVPSEIDIKSIANSRYREYVENLWVRPREAGRFELVRAGRQQLTDEVMTKLSKLKQARLAALSEDDPGGDMSCAFVDAHRSDLTYAQALERFLSEHNIDVTSKTSSNTSAAKMAQFEMLLSSFPLYIVVSGNADQGWVENRCTAAIKTAAVNDLKAIIAQYIAPVGEQEQLRIRYDCIEDTNAKDRLILEFGSGIS